MEWKNIEGYPNHEISSSGLVRSRDMVLPHSRGGTRLRRGKQLILRPNKQGYLRVQLVKGGRMELVHRLVAKAFIPNPENKPQVNHLDRNTSNNPVENLEWCTVRENFDHVIISNRRKCLG